MIAWPATICSGGGCDAEADAELELLADWLADGDTDTLEEGVGPHDFERDAVLDRDRDAVEDRDAATYTKVAAA